MAFNDITGASKSRLRLNNIWIERSLSQEMGIRVFACFLFKNFDKSSADDFAFLLRITDAHQFFKKEFSSIYYMWVETLDFFKFAQAMQTVIDIDGNQLLAD